MMDEVVSLYQTFESLLERAAQCEREGDLARSAYLEDKAGDALERGAALYDQLSPADKDEVARLDIYKWARMCASLM